MECIRLLDELLLWIDTLEEPTKKKPLGLGKIEDFIETEHKD